MDLTLSDLQICHKTQPTNKPTNKKLGFFYQEKVLIHEPIFENLIRYT